MSFKTKREQAYNMKLKDIETLGELIDLLNDYEIYNGPKKGKK